jgi:penicillin amidase
MRLIEERFQVKGAPDQTMTLKFTRHGPVVFEDREQHLAYAIRTVWSEPGCCCLSREHLRHASKKSE